MIHADYSGAGGIVIERYRDKFILSNSGTLLISSEQLRCGGTSECRNKALQTMFMMIGGGEKAGSDVHRIQNEWKNQHWRAPAFNIDEQSDRVRLVLPMISLIPEMTLASLEKRFGASFRHLKNLEVVALATADIEGEVSNARLQELELDHPADITQTLQNLCSKRMLFSDNRRRWSRYRIYNSHYNEGSSGHDDLKKRSSINEIRKAICLLCLGKYQEPIFLAKALERTQDNLRKRHLTPMARKVF